MVSTEILRRLPCFRNAESEQLESIARKGELRTLARDAFLFRAGDRSDCLYILISGQLVVSICDQRGQRLQLALIEPGTCLGEMGLSQCVPRSADVVAQVDSVLMQIHRNQFDALVRELPGFALTLLADLSKKLQDANRRLESRVALPVKERLWLALNSLANAECIDPAPRVTHLAAQIDASREMTSKALSQLVRENRVTKETAKRWSLHCSSGEKSR